MYDPEEQPQLPPLLPENHWADAGPQRLNTARPPHNEVRPNDDRGMETFLPERRGQKAVK